jgi:hypothetical protein
MIAWLLIILTAAAGCLAVQVLHLDDHLDAWLAHWTKTCPLGDDGCWLDAALLILWISALVAYAGLNVGGLLWTPA